MKLLPNFLARPLAPLLLAPWQLPGVARRLNEGAFDYYATLLHPQWRLRRVVCRVEALRLVASDALAITLRPSRNWAGFRPGQYAELFVEIDGVRHGRYYSLSSAPGRPGRLEIVVKREADGRVSNWLHQQLRVGAWLELGPASGELVLASPPPPALLLISAGSGVTPLMAIIRQCLDQGYPGRIDLLHYARDRASLIHLLELERLARRYPQLKLHFGYTGEGGADDGLRGRFCAEHLVDWLPAGDGRQILACGPDGFVRAVRQWWQAHGQPGSLQTESFTPPALLLAAGDAPAEATLRFRRAQRVVTGNTRQPLLQQAEAHGLKPASGCRMGICHSCSCRKISGVVIDALTGEANSAPNQTIRLCVSVPQGDVEIDA